MGSMRVVLASLLSPWPCIFLDSTHFRLPHRSCIFLDSANSRLLALKRETISLDFRHEPYISAIRDVAAAAGVFGSFHRLHGGAFVKLHGASPAVFMGTSCRVSIPPPHPSETSCYQLVMLTPIEQGLKGAPGNFLCIPVPGTSTLTLVAQIST
jgi:hypothetical protein